MTVAKNIEISASSTKSFEHAIETGIAKAGETLDQVRGAWVKEMKVVVDRGKITEYRVHMLVTFVLQP